MKRTLTKCCKTTGLDVGKIHVKELSEIAKRMKFVTCTFEAVKRCKNSQKKQKTSQMMEPLTHTTMPVTLGLFWFKIESMRHFCLEGVSFAVFSTIVSCRPWTMWANIWNHETGHEFGTWYKFERPFAEIRQKSHLKLPRQLCARETCELECRRSTESKEGDENSQFWQFFQTPQWCFWDSTHSRFNSIARWHTKQLGIDHSCIFPASDVVHSPRFPCGSSYTQSNDPHQLATWISWTCETGSHLSNTEHLQTPFMCCLL